MRDRRGDVAVAIGRALAIAALFAILRETAVAALHLVSLPREFWPGIDPSVEPAKWAIGYSRWTPFAFCVVAIALAPSWRRRAEAWWLQGLALLTFVVAIAGVWRLVQFGRGLADFRQALEGWAADLGLHHGGSTLGDRGALLDMGRSGLALLGAAFAASRIVSGPSALGAWLRATAVLFAGLSLTYGMALSDVTGCFAGAGVTTASEFALAGALGVGVLLSATDGTDRERLLAWFVPGVAAFAALTFTLRGGSPARGRTCQLFDVPREATTVPRVSFESGSDSAAAFEYELHADAAGLRYARTRVTAENFRVELEKMIASRDAVFREFNGSSRPCSNEFLLVYADPKASMARLTEALDVARELGLAGAELAVGLRSDRDIGLGIVVHGVRVFRLALSLDPACECKLPAESGTVGDWLQGTGREVLRRRCFVGSAAGR